MKRTELYNFHLEAKAKMAEFGGYEMPMQYSNVKQEVLAVRERAGVFDVSHMGEFFVEGSDAVKFVDLLLANDFQNSPVGKAVYSPMCREDGTIIDDLIAYKLTPNKVMLCVNAANTAKDWNWISSRAGDFDIELTNKSDEYSLLALQGPKAFDILKAQDDGLEDIKPFSIQLREEGSTPVIYARTGYTGEDGFEIFGAHEVIQGLWKKLMENGVEPCGLAARDVLRLEAGFPLYGQEMDDSSTPLDCGLKWTVKFSKPSFIGKEALEKAQSKYINLKLILDKGIPRAGYPVTDDTEQSIGEITSGTMSVVLGKGIAMARIEKQKYNSSANLFVNIRNKNYPAAKHKGPFVTGGKSNE